MSSTFANLGKVVVILVGIPATLLLAYDVIAIQPRLDEVKGFLERAPMQDASPPRLIRELIDANSGDPSAYAVSQVVSRVYPKSPQMRWHMRNALWRLLLPLHVGKEGMYGLYSTLAFNGSDYGLSNFANREFAKPLDQLHPSQAATTVAITYMPTSYIRDRQRLELRAKFLLRKVDMTP